jgi:hypothetical protein
VKRNIGAALLDLLEMPQVSPDQTAHSRRNVYAIRTQSGATPHLNLAMLTAQAEGEMATPRPFGVLLQQYRLACRRRSWRSAQG